MRTWWTHLSYSHGAIVLILIVLVIMLLWYAFASLIEAATTDPRPRSWPIVDYSSAYEAKRRWLGKRFLLAAPINRRVTPISERESLVLLRRMDHARLGF